MFNPYNRNLSVKAIVELDVGANEITYKEETLNKTLSVFTVFEINFRGAFQKSSKHFISHALQ